MPPGRAWRRTAAILLCGLAALPLAAAAQTGDEAPPSPLVTAAVLEARLAEARIASDLTDDARERLIGLYRRSLGNLKMIQANRAAGAAYRGTAEAAPGRIEALRAARAEIAAEDSVAELDLDPDSPLPLLQRRLQEERADLAAVRARYDDLATRLKYQEARPSAVRQRLTEADAARETVFADLQAEATKSADKHRVSALSQARRWELETRYLALSTEIQMLDQELLSRPARLQLLQAQKDKEAASIEWITARVAALEDRILAARQQAAELAGAEAERIRRETVGMDPALIGLSEANAELPRDIDSVTAGLRELDQARARANRLHRQIDADYRDARDALESDEVSDDLGAVLLGRLDAMPDLTRIRQQREQRRLRMAHYQTRLLQQRAEVRRLGDIATNVASLRAALGRAPTQVEEDWLRQLLTQRLTLLEQTIEIEALYLAEASEVEAAEDALLATGTEYETLLLERLVWLRTEPSPGFGEFLTLPDQLRAMLATADAAELGTKLIRDLRSSPLFWSVLLLAVALRLARRRIVAAIEGIAVRVGKIDTDSFGLTLRVLGLTVLLALPWPLLLDAAGWTAVHASTGSELLAGMGESLLRVAAVLLTLNLLSAVCLPKGLAAVHFRWQEPTLGLLRTSTRRLTWLLIPAIAVLHLSQDLNPLDSGGTLARLASIIGFGAVAWFLYRVFHPRRGVMALLRHPDAYQLLMGTYWFWYPALALFPIALLMLALSGYLYTARVESANFLHSLQLLFALVVLNALALRWLLVVRLRIAKEAALERRRAAREATAAAADGESATEAVDTPFQEPEVDLSALSDDTRGLIHVGLGAVAVAGLLLIWSDLLPAFRVLEDQVLWSTTVTVDGEEQQHPVTLMHLGLALLFAAGTWVLLKRMPALLEIVLLRRSAMSGADRYTVTTVTNYVIGATGILLVLGTLGASWSQLQWTAAALSVGIGFGLQEIVANFISGLIILFERPIRVGDTVTVGDTDGVVTRIRIRATTIRNFDRKELLVPNKEFITGRLLNWSLSDPVTRVVLVVGVAYGSDVERASAIMTRIARANEHVIDEPPPVVTFDTFGDNALTLTLRAFVDSVDVRIGTISALNRAINEAFTDAGISIAFPQRDLHLDTTRPLQIELRQSATTSEGRTLEGQPTE